MGGDDVQGLEAVRDEVPEVVLRYVRRQEGQRLGTLEEGTARVDIGSCGR